jgi:hypothetical protein
MDDDIETMDDDEELDDQGETLRYVDGDRHLFVEVALGSPCTLFTWSARRWTFPKDVPLSDAEFALAVERMVGFLVKSGLGPVTIDDRAPGTAVDPTS